MGGGRRGVGLGADIDCGWVVERYEKTACLQVQRGTIGIVKHLHNYKSPPKIVANAFFIFAFFGWGLFFVSLCCLPFRSAAHRPAPRSVWTGRRSPHSTWSPPADCRASSSRGNRPVWCSARAGGWIANGENDTIQGVSTKLNLSPKFTLKD
jgi:hypothetical protein